MKESGIYFQNFCSSKGQALSFHVERVISKSISFKEEIELYNIIFGFIEEIDSVSKLYSISEHEINSFDNYVSLLDFVKYPTLKKYLVKYNYLEKQALLYQEIITKIKADELLNDYELEFLDFFVKHGRIAPEDKDVLIKYFCKLIITRVSKSRLLSYDSIKRLLKEYFNNEIKQNDLIASLDFKNDKSREKTISLSEDDLRKFYVQGICNILLEFYKQLYLVKVQYGICSEKEIKDYILSMNDKNYFESNKRVISFSIKAKEYAINQIVNFIKDLGIEFEIGSGKKLKDLNKQFDNNDREYQDKVYDLDELFSEFKKRSGIANMYEEYKKGKAA